MVHGTPHGITRLGLHDWAGVVVAPAYVPEDGRARQNQGEEGDRIVHRKRCDGSHRRQYEDNGHKKRPQACPRIDGRGELAKVPWSWLELAKE